mgnify:CR=1 FL=1
MYYETRENFKIAFAFVYFISFVIILIIAIVMSVSYLHEYICDRDLYRAQKFCSQPVIEKGFDKLSDCLDFYENNENGLTD